MGTAGDEDRSYWLYGRAYEVDRVVTNGEGACEGHEMKVVYPSMPGVVFLRTVQPLFEQYSHFRAVCGHRRRYSGMQAVQSADLPGIAEAESVRVAKRVFLMK